MSKVIQIERRKRGFLGKIFLILFWLFNIFMAVALFSAMDNNAGEMAALSSDAERAGYAVGTAIGGGIILFVWLAGAVILGLFALLTRGNKVIVEKVTA